MTDQQPTYEQIVVQRLSNRIGQLSVTIEVQQLQIESFVQCLRDNGINPETLQPESRPGHNDEVVIGSNHD